MTTLLIDFNNLAVRTVFMDKQTINNPNPDWNLHKHSVLTSIFYNIRKFKPNEVILAVDDKNCWRKNIFKEYKAHRKDKKDNDIFPWDRYHAYIDEYIQQIKECFPFVILSPPFTEADDTIAIVAKHLHRTPKVVVSADSDYIQLLSTPNLKLYNPLTMKFIEDEDPKLTLEIKILAGDKGDNIPNVQPRLGPKTAMKLIKENKVEELLKDDALMENYKRNRRLIDWGYIPIVIQTRILKDYDEYILPNKGNLFNFFLNHRLRQHMEDISIIQETLAPLVRERHNSEFKKLFCEA
jgi:5'-3' exonuclease